MGGDDKLETLFFNLDGQKLTKSDGFPDVVEKSKDFLKIIVNGIPDGFTATGYFTLSWETDTVYNQQFDGDELVVDEYLTTIPSDHSDYYDYTLRFSVVAINSDGNRLTSNVENIVLKHSNYSSDTTNTPEIPQSQYESFVEEISDYATAAANSAADAATSASYSNHPPQISDDGYWEVWNGTAYEVTEYPAKGEIGLPTISTTQPGGGLFFSNIEYRLGGLSTDLYVDMFTNNDQTKAPIWCIQFTVNKDNFAVTMDWPVFEWYLAEPQFVRGNTYMLTFVEIGDKIVCVWMEVAA